MRHIEVPIPTTYTDVSLWILAIIGFFILGIIASKKIHNTSGRIIVMIVTVVLSVFCGLASYAAYEEAAGHMIM